MKEKKSFYIVVQSTLLKSEIFSILGKALLLLLWFYDKVTFESCGVGFVYGGIQKTYDELAKEIGMHPNSIKKMIKLLSHHGYIYVKKGFGGVGSYFTLGFQKEVGQNSAYRYKMIEKVLDSIRQKIANNEINIRNPLFENIDFGGSVYSLEKQIFVSQQTKNGRSYTDNTNDNTSDNASDNTSENKNDMKDDNFLAEEEMAEQQKKILEIFRLYSSLVLSSNSTEPDTSEYKIIEKALEIEGSENLLKAIENYNIFLKNNTKYNPYSVKKFFEKSVYSSYLREKEKSGNDDDDRPEYEPAGGWQSKY